MGERIDRVEGYYNIESDQTETNRNRVIGGGKIRGEIWNIRKIETNRIECGWRIKSAGLERERRSAGNHNTPPQRVARFMSASCSVCLMRGRAFGKVVGNILFGAAVRNDDVAGEDVITDEVMTNVDVLGTSVELMVARERDSSEIVC